MLTILFLLFKHFRSGLFVAGFPEWSPLSKSVLNKNRFATEIWFTKDSRSCFHTLNLFWISYQTEYCNLREWSFFPFTDIWTIMFSSHMNLCTHKHISKCQGKNMCFPPQALIREENYFARGYRQHKLPISIYCLSIQVSILT